MESVWGVFGGQLPCLESRADTGSIDGDRLIVTSPGEGDAESERTLDVSFGPVTVAVVVVVGDTWVSHGVTTNAV